MLPPIYTKFSSSSFTFESYSYAVIKLSVKRSINDMMDQRLSAEEVPVVGPKPTTKTW